VLGFSVFEMTSSALLAPQVNRGSMLIIQLTCFSLKANASRGSNNTCTQARSNWSNQATDCAKPKHWKLNRRRRKATLFNHFDEGLPLLPKFFFIFHLTWPGIPYVWYLSQISEIKKMIVAIWAIIIFQKWALSSVNELRLHWAPIIEMKNYYKHTLENTNEM